MNAFAQSVPTDTQQEVHDAAFWLDEKYPGWADKIDLDRFGMGDSSVCIGHYLQVDWYSDLCLRWTRYSRGLYTENDPGSISQVFAAYTEFWREEILARRN